MKKLEKEHSATWKWVPVPSEIEHLWATRDPHGRIIKMESWRRCRGSIRMENRSVKPEHQMHLQQLTPPSMPPNSLQKLPKRAEMPGMCGWIIGVERQKNRCISKNDGM